MKVVLNKNLPNEREVSLDSTERVVSVGVKSRRVRYLIRKTLSNFKNYCRKHGKFDHGGMFHNDSFINDMIANGPYMSMQDWELLAHLSPSRQEAIRQRVKYVSIKQRVFNRLWHFLDRRGIEALPDKLTHLS